MRLPVAIPLAWSRGLTTEWETAMIMIEFSRPFWVTEPLIAPCFCPFSVKYELRAMTYRTFSPAARPLDSVYAPLRAGRWLAPWELGLPVDRSSGRCRRPTSDPGYFRSSLTVTI